jgi:hypothetical protein
MNMELRLNQMEKISHQPYYRLKYRVREAITSYLNPLKASDATVDIVYGQY